MLITKCFKLSELFPRVARTTVMGILPAVAIGVCQGSSNECWADTPHDRVQHEREASQYNADNTGRNERDKNDARKTADDQQLGGDNTEVLARIRRAVVDNDNLSTYAKNVKIIVEGGAVTLRGPVKTVQEKEMVASAAKREAPNLKVVNELEIDQVTNHH